MKEVLAPEEELAIIRELENYDTPTITNVVATYPGKAESKKMKMLASTSDVEKLKKYMQGVYD